MINFSVKHIPRKIKQHTDYGPITKRKEDNENAIEHNSNVQTKEVRNRTQIKEIELDV